MPHVARLVLVLNPIRLTMSHPDAAPLLSRRLTVSFSPVLVFGQLLNGGVQGEKKYTEVVPWLESLIFHFEESEPVEIRTLEVGLGLDGWW